VKRKQSKRQKASEAKRVRGWRRRRKIRAAVAEATARPSALHIEAGPPPESYTVRRIVIGTDGAVHLHDGAGTVLVITPVAIALVPAAWDQITARAEVLVSDVQGLVRL
jgi:hypothetical protein